MTGGLIDADCAACGAALTSELDWDVDELNAEHGLTLTNPCPRCGARAITVAPGRYLRNERGYLVRVGDVELPG
jgi:hypothetical protein